LPRHLCDVPSSHCSCQTESSITFFNMISITTVLVVLVGAAIVYLVNYLAHSNKNGRPLPPGPKGLPLLGNVNDLPKPGVLECHHWAQHKELYGPISSLTVLGQTFIIINDAQLALELLRDRSAIHSARPHMVFSSDMYVCFTRRQAHALTKTQDRMDEHPCVLWLYRYFQATSDQYRQSCWQHHLP
jgi:hypothetical protein